MQVKWSLIFIYHVIAYFTWVTYHAHNFLLFIFFTCLLYQELQALKSLDHKFSEFSTKYLLESFLMCSFVSIGFVNHLLMP